MCTTFTKLKSTTLIKASQTKKEIADKLSLQVC